jgi:hypothetical protein
VIDARVGDGDDDDPLRVVVRRVNRNEPTRTIAISRMIESRR